MPGPSPVLATCQNLDLRFSAQVVLDGASLTIHEGDKLGIVGRNGCGKSSFLRILAKVDSPDGGTVAWRTGLTTGYLPQDFALDDSLTVLENLRLGARHLLALIEEFEAGQASASRLAELQNLIDATGGWNLDTRIESSRNALGVAAPHRPVAELSGGEKRRVALCQAILGDPDLLILDEPTNHLDAESIEWLESFMKARQGACVFVTHDRYFLDRVATRIAELSSGRFFAHDGGYSGYLAAKAERQAIDANTEARRQSFLRRELQWVRAGVQARRTKEQNRLDRFFEIDGQDQPEEELDAQFIIPPPPKLGNVVVKLENTAIHLGDKLLFHGLNLDFAPGTCTGVIGRNGLGKTTLIQVLMGLLPPDEGTVTIGQKTRFNYADQNRIVIDGSKSMIEEVGGGADFIPFGTEKLHIRSYLSRFLFTGETVHARIDTLSGGEKNRVMLAKILHAGGNFLILDEPTNDLDLATLRVLEEAILSFPGVVLAVSHDRYFLDRIADRIIAFEGEGRVVIQEGNYSYYAEKRTARRLTKSPSPSSSKDSLSRPKPNRPRKLTWSEERELEGLEPAILAAESRCAAINALFEEPGFYETHGPQTEALSAERDALHRKLDELFARWDHLDSIRRQSQLP